MPSFVFRLQSVLDARKSREEQVQTEHAEAKQALAVEEEKLAGMEGKKARMMHHLRSERDRFANAEEIRIHVEYIKDWSRRIEAQKDVVARRREAVEKKRQELVAAVRERKVMENLKEKQEEAFRQEQSATERLAFDETAVLRHGRKEP